MIFTIAGIEAKWLPIVQDSIGRYYANSAGLYYEPIYKDFYNESLVPVGYKKYTNGSHYNNGQYLWYQGMRQFPYDIYCLPSSPYRVDRRLKVVAIYGDANNPQGYFVVQFVDNPDIVWLCVHSYTTYKVDEIIPANEVFGYSNVSEGHLHICEFVKNVGVDIALRIFDYSEPVPPTPTPGPDPIVIALRKDVDKIQSIMLEMSKVYKDISDKDKKISELLVGVKPE